ncbi:MAG: hypothetical protein NVS4B3_22120 [Gemmatimonadaceae bacterium]
MIPRAWLDGEIAVIGLGKSGLAAAMLLTRHGATVYASDSASGPATSAAAEGLSALGVATTVGGHDLERIARASIVVTSPGIPPEAPPIVTARAADRQIIGELEVALRILPELKYIAITGTNGKTTTTALTAHLLSGLGIDASAAGNIGTPLAELALRSTPPAWAAREVSSF